MPIPALLEKDADEAVTNGDFIRHVGELIGKGGSDIWWKASVDDLLTSEVGASQAYR